jgi:hypothetical protein
VGGTNASPIFFLPKNVFFDYGVEKGIKKIGARVGEEMYVR